MRKDFKTGLFSGAVIAVMGWFFFVFFSDSLQQRRQKQLDSQFEKTIQPQFVEPVKDTLPAKKAHLERDTSNNAGANAKFHTVAEGQTLGSISVMYYGVSTKWEKILNANLNQIQSPTQIKPGMKLIIPPDTP